MGCRIGSNVITQSLRSERQAGNQRQRAGGSRGPGDTGLGFGDGGKVMNQRECGWPPEAWKGEEAGSPRESPEFPGPADTLTLVLWNYFWSDLQNFK